MPQKPEEKGINPDMPFGEIDCGYCDLKKPVTLRELLSHNKENEKIHEAFERGYQSGMHEKEIRRKIFFIKLKDRFFNLFKS